jgi:bifunctional DNA-binding transcriptional regulator/antitoxin component of YhaV-PrlF toxin-antitoxin module
VATRTKLKRRRGYTRLSGKRQITLPIAAVEAMGLGPGDELRVDAVGGQIILTREEGLTERRRRAIQLAAGTLTGLYEPGYLNHLRDEWR